jgi:hypothetical protein
MRAGCAGAKNSPRNLLSSFTTFQPLHTIFASNTRSERGERLHMRKRVWHAIAVAVFSMAVVSATSAQQQPAETKDPDPPAAPKPADAANSASQGKTAEAAKPPNPFAPVEHRFWDAENDWLFAAVGAGRALDYASTLNLRRRGINEAFLTNSIVDNHPLFASIEAAATGASIGVSYIFHRTGHHRLERWTSAIHAGVAVGGAIRNYCLKTPHPG